MRHIILLMAALLVVNHAYAVEDAALQTLKSGSAVLKELPPIPEIKKWHDTERIPRSYPQQPPLIPHTTKGYVINLKFNKCLTCHSKDNAGMSGATPVSGTHYFNRDGQFSTKIAGRRYFCVQCHVPQVDSEPLIANDFKAAK
jgi:cytochrome c-type protein NapB